MVFLVRGKQKEKWKMKRKKNEEYEESQITTINISGFTFYVKNYMLLKNIVWENVVYASSFIYSFYHTPKFNIHKYTNHNIIEICIYRLSTITDIFIAMDYLILQSEKYLHFRKSRKHLAQNFFFHPVKVTGSLFFAIIFRFMCIS